jgi:hypothetical protein
VNRLSSDTFVHWRRTTAVLAATTALGLGGAAAAQAQVAFPTPGSMTVTGVPLKVRAGHTFTLHEMLPLAVFNGKFALQSESPSGVWQTLVSAPPRPRIAWLHWKVRAALRGSHLTVRYLLISGAQMLAVSPNYTMSVTS